VKSETGKTDKDRREMQDTTLAMATTACLERRLAVSQTRVSLIPFHSYSDLREEKKLSKSVSPSSVISHFMGVKVPSGV